jgi:hypothetical protein
MRHLERIFSLDLRALALMRIAIGLLLLADLVIRLPDLNIFYTHEGNFPLRYITSAHYTSKQFFAYRWLDNQAGAACLFALAACAALMLVVGIRTRLAMVVSWFLLVSLQSRNTYLLDMGDVYLRIVMLWCIFLPMGARYSLDALRNRHWEQLPNRFFSLPAAGYIMQVSVVYGVAGILKSDPLWTTRGDALFYALSIDQFSTAFAQQLLHYPTFLKPFNFFALAAELMAPLLICSPVWTWRCRLAAVALLTSLHLGIASCMHLGLLVPICIAMLIGLWPTEFIDHWDRNPAPERHPSEAGTTLAPPPNYSASRARTLFAASLIVYTLVQNALVIPQLNIKPYSWLIPPVVNYGRVFAVLQNWQLFAPYPFTEDGWFIIEGHRQDGLVIDLMRQGQPVSYYKPALVSAQFKNQRWRRYYQNLWRRNNPLHIPYYCKWEMDRWNRVHPQREQLTKVRFVFVQETTKDPGQALNLESFVMGEYPSPAVNLNASTVEDCNCQDHAKHQD